MTAPATVPTDADLLETVSSLVGPAAHVQLWLFPLDADGVPLRVVIPIEDVPLDAAVMPHLGERVGRMGETAGWASLVLVWERPGPAWLTTGEEEVVAAFRGERAAAPRRVPLARHRRPPHRIRHGSMRGCASRP